MYEESLSDCWVVEELGLTKTENEDVFDDDWC